MKKLMLTLICAFTAPVLFAQAHNNWLTNFEQAKTQAAKENKKILISFSGSDWCNNCMRLEHDLFEQEEFANYAQENLVLLKLDFPAKKKNQLPPEQKAHNEKLAAKYNKKGTFPQVIIVNPDGSIQGTMQHPASNASEYLNSIDALSK